ncbi:MAG: glycosyltransferase, partial [Candidatus Scalindua sp.]|nr:glycosyltransferase [Candidatus Scalindua sp.]
MKISIIVRAKNEERWITSSLNAIFNQSFKDIEVILVDNQSTDMTVAKARKFNVKVLQTEDYLPGKALNLGIEASSGEFIASISAHCIPKDRYWLSNLLRNFEDESVAGVYGRQEPMSFTNDLDKRDLHITFGLDRRIQVKDCFFHNANSLIKKSVWEKIPFDETITNIEDRVWGQRVIDTGYKIIYEPEAAVFHHHGIHQSMDIERCKNIVRIMESLNENNGSKDVNIDSFLDNLNIVGIVVVKGDMEYLSGEPLIKYTIDKARESKLIDKLVVSTDNTEILEYSKRMGTDITIMRPVDLSGENIGIEKVLQYTLARLEEDMNILPDVIVYLGVQSPFRPKGL